MRHGLVAVFALACLCVTAEADVRPRETVMAVEAAGGEAGAGKRMKELLSRLNERVMRMMDRPAGGAREGPAARGPGTVLLQTSNQSGGEDSPFASPWITSPWVRTGYPNEDLQPHPGIVPMANKDGMCVVGTMFGSIQLLIQVGSEVIQLPLLPIADMKQEFELLFYLNVLGTALSLMGCFIASSILSRLGMLMTLFAFCEWAIMIVLGFTHATKGQGMWDPAAAMQKAEEVDNRKNRAAIKELGQLFEHIDKVGKEVDEVSKAGAELSDALKLRQNRALELLLWKLPWYMNMAREVEDVFNKDQIDCGGKPIWCQLDLVKEDINEERVAQHCTWLLRGAIFTLGGGSEKDEARYREKHGELRLQDGSIKYVDEWTQDGPIDRAKWKELKVPPGWPKDSRLAKEVKCEVRTGQYFASNALLVQRTSIQWGPLIEAMAQYMFKKKISSGILGHDMTLELTQQRTRRFVEECPPSCALFISLSIATMDKTGKTRQCAKQPEGADKLLAPQVVQDVADSILRVLETKDYLETRGKSSNPVDLGAHAQLKDRLKESWASCGCKCEFA